MLAFGGLLLIREWKPGRAVRTYLPLTDGLGSVCGLIDASDGSLATEYDYDPYGNPVVGCGPAMDACPFRHRTRYYDPETWLYYYGYRYYDPSVTKWISKDPLGEAGGWNLTCFCGNDPVNQYDPLGLNVYGVYRQFNDQGGSLSQKFQHGQAGGIGHVYLAFDEEGVDRAKWQKLVDQYHNDPNNPIVPGRRPSPLAETFSFHPWKVRELNGVSDASNDTGARAGLPENFATTGSYIGYNDSVDQGAFLRAKEYQNLSGFALLANQLSDTRLEGVIVKIATTEDEQFALYRAAQVSRIANNLNATATDVGHYSVAWRNCGFWAVTMFEQQKLSIPQRVRGFNKGVGVNPKGKLHAAGRVTAAGVQGAAAIANTVGAQYSVYNNFDDESLIMDSDYSPVVGIGLKWSFGR